MARFMRRVHCEPRLADTARPDERDQASRREAIVKLGELDLPSDEGIGVDRRQPAFDRILGPKLDAARHRAWPHHLHDRFGLEKALQAVHPAVDERHLHR